MSAFDIPEQQVLLHHDDPGFSWHHRILLVAAGPGGRWIGCSTDYEVEIIELLQYLVLPLTRGLPFPARVAGDFYSVQPVRIAALDRARAEARALALALGVAPAVAPGPTGIVWLFSDTSYTSFGLPVPEELLIDPVAVVERQSVGLVNVPADGWTTMERIRRDDLEAWKAEKAGGPGRDSRVLPILRDAQRTRYRTVREALGQITPLLEPPAADWPFRGPSATMELLVSIRAVSDDFGQFHEYFCKTSGLSTEHAVAVKHRELLGVLLHLTCFDQLNITQLAGREACARYILQVHQAVRKNPKAPDFRGLGVMTSSRLDASGGILTGSFAKFVAEEQKSDAFTMKQQRLFAEEDEKRKGHGKGGDKKNP